MIRDALYRLSFTVLMAGTALIAGANVVSVRSDAPPPVSIQVSPKIAMAHARVTFRIMWKIPLNPENRAWSMSYGCTSGDSSSSSGTLDGENEAVTREVFRDISTGEGCAFETCLYRRPGKPFACARQVVGTGGSDGR